MQATANEKLIKRLLYKVRLLFKIVMKKIISKVRQKMVTKRQAKRLKYYYAGCTNCTQKI